MSEATNRTNPVFAVFYTRDGKSLYSMIQAPNPDEAIKRFNAMHNNKFTVDQVGIMSKADGLPHKITDETRKFFGWQKESEKP